MRRMFYLGPMQYFPSVFRVLRFLNRVGGHHSCAGHSLPRSAL
jgi:hypothetical protein